MTARIVLLGDSILDNAAYTEGAPDVVEHLRATLPPGWEASLCAVDGSTAADLPAQLRRVPSDVSHFVVSVGGNDALQNLDLLETPVHSTAETLGMLADRIDKFESVYVSAIEAVLATGTETSVCTVYNGNLDADIAQVARVALMTFNDVILRTAFERRLAVIDLRFVCTDPSDYANPIEPSGTGGRKIAEAIARSCGALDCPSRSVVYAG